MEMEEKLLQATSKTFGKFCDLLAKVDPVTALLVTGAGITTVMGSAFVAELLNQQELYRSGGAEAVKAYTSLGAKSSMDFMLKGVASALPSDAQNTMGKSMLAMLTLPLTACVTALVAGKFKNLKDEIKTLEQGGRHNEVNQASRVTYPVRDTCATRVNDVERFDKSLAALSRKIEEVQNMEAAQPHLHAGPKQ